MDGYNNILSDFMKQKSIWMNDFCNIPSEWYFVDEDEKEIFSWDEKTARQIWEKIKTCIEKNEASGLNYKLCPFCYKNKYNHSLTKPGRCNPSCIECGYGTRHGKCTEDASKSQYKKILDEFAKVHMNVYKCLANDYYTLTIAKLESKYLNK